VSACHPSYVGNWDQVYLFLNESLSGPDHDEQAEKIPMNNLDMSRQRYILPNESQRKVIREAISLLARVYSPLAALKQMQKMELHPSATPSWKAFLGYCPSAGCWGSLEIGEVIWTQVGSIQLNLRNFRLDTLFISASETLFQLKILAFIEGPFQL
jgi:hypothetical protein